MLFRIRKIIDGTGQERYEVDEECRGIFGIGKQWVPVWQSRHKLCRAHWPTHEAVKKWILEQQKTEEILEEINI